MPFRVTWQEFSWKRRVGEEAIAYGRTRMSKDEVRRHTVCLKTIRDRETDKGKVTS